MKKSNKLYKIWKRTLTSVIYFAEAFILIVGITACGVKNDGAGSQPGTVISSDTRLGTEQSDITQSGTAQSDNMQSGTPSSDTTQAELIRLEDAKQAALIDAGVSASDVIYTKETLDYENGIAVYDIEFYIDNVEYEYEINAVTGAVYSKNVETHQTQTGYGEQTGASEMYIGVDNAASLALNHAGFSEKDVSRLRTEFDMDDGQAVYEVDFDKDGREYEYKINAIDGSILEYEVD
ncbi:MAG: PepSY domain-containing protein [Bacteroides sp.]|nr:PepSY domain-containing protein [Bacteroides sp.]MCM1550928.1 PepSY domain-containing protein [Clostridium sp.]